MDRGRHGFRVRVIDSHCASAGTVRADREIGRLYGSLSISFHAERSGQKLGGRPVRLRPRLAALPSAPQAVAPAPPGCHRHYIGYCPLPLRLVRRVRCVFILRSRTCLRIMEHRERRSHARGFSTLGANASCPRAAGIRNQWSSGRPILKHEANHCGRHTP